MSKSTARQENLLHIRSRVQNQHQPLSERLYGLNWENYLPLRLPSSGINLVASNYDETMSFIAKNYEEIHELQEQKIESFTGNKEAYYREFGDFLLFKDGNSIVGAQIFCPIDWSTYYSRTTSILRSHQGKNILQDFVEFMISVLKRHQISRLEAEISPAQKVMVHTLNKLGFTINGMKLTDRWGSVLQLVLYLDQTQEESFKKQFCFGAMPKIRNKV